MKIREWLKREARYMGVMLSIGLFLSMGYVIWDLKTEVQAGNERFSAAYREAEELDNSLQEYHRKYLALAQLRETEQAAYTQLFQEFAQDAENRIKTEATRANRLEQTVRDKDKEITTMDQEYRAKLHARFVEYRTQLMKNPTQLVAVPNEPKWEMTPVWPTMPKIQIPSIPWPDLAMPNISWPTIAMPSIPWPTLPWVQAKKDPEPVK